MDNLMIWIMDKSTRHELIDRYFEGELSREDERMLRSELLRLTDPDNIEREALAVMSYSLFNADKRGRKEEPRSGKDVAHLRRHRWLTYTAAAVIAVAVMTVGVTLLTGSSVKSDCYAYIGGERIDDRETVMRILDSQLDEMKEASEGISREIESDLGDFRDALKSDDIMFESENKRI